METSSEKNNQIRLNRESNKYMHFYRTEFCVCCHTDPVF